MDAWRASEGARQKDLKESASTFLLLTWEFRSVNRTAFVVSFALATLPVAATAAIVASTAIANGTYTVKVVKVVDAKHVDVVLDSGQEATLPAGRPYVDFSKVQANDQVKLSLIDGNVMVFVDLTSH